MLKKVVLAFLQEGLFIRGGLAYSQHFKSSHVTYSHAVARAYELESTIAVYPRVIIDNSILQTFRETPGQAALVASQLVCCCNNVHFLNVVDAANWKQVQAAPEIRMRDEQVLRGRENEFLKHAWFERYLFSSAFSSPDCPRYIPVIELLPQGPGV